MITRLCKLYRLATPLMLKENMAPKLTKAPRERKKVDVQTRLDVLTEAGYRCAVPTCRMFLALDMHHIYRVAEDGPDAIENLIALCPTDHRLYHKGHIKRESIYAWKTMLVTLSRAFDTEAIDRLLLLAHLESPQTPGLGLQGPGLGLQGEGLLQFANLIASRLVIIERLSLHDFIVYLSPQGQIIIVAWKKGDRVAPKSAIDSRLPLGAVQ
jgi:hypothetical protein